MSQGIGNTEGNTQIYDYDAFISYATRDLEAVMSVVQQLEQNGLRCWLAPRDMRPGVEYGTEIINGIKSSKCMVTFLSEASIKSRHVRAEVERAVDGHKTIYPVRLEDVELGEALEFFLSIRQSIDIFDDPTESTVLSLVAAIKDDKPPEAVSSEKAKKVIKPWVKYVIAGAILVTVFSAVVDSVRNALILRKYEKMAADISDFRTNKLEDIETSIDINGRSYGVMFFGRSFLSYEAMIEAEEGQLQVSINGSSFERIDSNKEYDLAHIDSVLVRALNKRGKVVKAADLTDKVKQKISSHVQSRIQWGDDAKCDLGGCYFVGKANDHFCNQGIDTVHVRQKSVTNVAEIDRAICAIEEDERPNFCFNFQNFPEQMQAKEDYFLIIKTVDGTSKTFALKNHT